MNRPTCSSPRPQALLRIPTLLALASLIPTAGYGFETLTHDLGHSLVHTTSPGNIVGDATILHHPLADEFSGADIFLTANWNPGGAGGSYYTKNPALHFNGGLGCWTIANQDGSPATRTGREKRP